MAAAAAMNGAVSRLSWGRCSAAGSATAASTAGSAGTDDGALDVTPWTCAGRGAAGARRGAGCAAGACTAISRRVTGAGRGAAFGLAAVVRGFAFGCVVVVLVVVVAVRGFEVEYWSTKSSVFHAVDPSNTTPTPT